MTTYIALLRGVNVGGKRKVSMAELQATVVAMGFNDARTLLNSGNVVFSSKRKLTTAALELLLETEIAQRLGLQTDFHVRTAAEWRTVIDANPLPEAAIANPSHLIAYCLKVVPAPEAVAALRAANPGQEVICADGRQMYVDFGPALAMRDTKLTPALMDSRLRTRGTGRNWNTVLKLAALASTTR